MGPAVPMPAALTQCPGQRYWLAACFGDAVEWHCYTRREHNCPVLIPSSPTPDRRIAQHLDPATRRVHGLQFAFGKKSEASAVGRPEWIDRIFCAADFLCARSGEDAHPEMVKTIGADCHKGQSRPVG